MFPKHYRGELYLVLWEVMGHLDVLEEEGLVTLEDGWDSRAGPRDGQRDGSPVEEA